MRISSRRVKPRQAAAGDLYFFATLARCCILTAILASCLITLIGLVASCRCAGRGMPSRPLASISCRKSARRRCEAYRCLRRFAAGFRHAAYFAIMMPSEAGYAMISRWSAFSDDAYAASGLPPGHRPASVSYCHRKMSAQYTHHTSLPLDTVTGLAIARTYRSIADFSPPLERHAAVERFRYRARPRRIWRLLASCPPT